MLVGEQDAVQAVDPIAAEVLDAGGTEAGTAVYEDGAMGGKRTIPSEVWSIMPLQLQAND